MTSTCESYAALSKDQLVSLVLILKNENEALKQQLADRNEEPIVRFPETAHYGDNREMPTIALHSDDSWLSGGRASPGASETEGRASVSQALGSSVWTTTSTRPALSASEPQFHPEDRGSLCASSPPPISACASPTPPPQRPLSPAPAPALRYTASVPGPNTPSVSCGRLYVSNFADEFAAHRARAKTDGPKSASKMATLTDGGSDIDVQQSEQQLGARSASLVSLGRLGHQEESMAHLREHPEIFVQPNALKDAVDAERAEQAKPRRSLKRHPSQKTEISGADRARLLMERKRQQDQDNGEECVIS